MATSRSVNGQRCRSNGDMTHGYKAVYPIIYQKPMTQRLKYTNPPIMPTLQIVQSLLHHHVHGWIWETGCQDQTSQSEPSALHSGWTFGNTNKVERWLHTLTCRECVLVTNITLVDDRVPRKRLKQLTLDFNSRISCGSSPRQPVVNKCPPLELHL